jgi:hypothetical protein
MRFSDASVSSENLGHSAEKAQHAPQFWQGESRLSRLSIF